MTAFRVDLRVEQVDGHPHRSPECVPPEEPVQPVRCTDAEEVGRRVVDLTGDRPGHIDREDHGPSDQVVARHAECATEAVEAVIFRRAGRAREAGWVATNVDGRPAVEVLQILPEGVKVEVSVLADCIKLVVPVVHEDAAVHIAEDSAATDAAWTHGE